MGHDSSSNAKDNLTPRNVVISGSVSAPGTVTYTIETGGFHQPVVYAAGIEPGDVPVPPFPPNMFLSSTDPTVLAAGQIAKAPLHMPAQPTVTWTTSFTRPGKYLVICNLTPHFGFFNMYGWVTVK